MTNTIDRLVAFVEENPGAKVGDVMSFFEIDAASAWSRIIDAGRLGLVKSFLEEDGWRLYVA